MQQEVKDGFFQQQGLYCWRLLEISSFLGIPLSGSDSNHENHMPWQNLYILKK